MEEYAFIDLHIHTEHSRKEDVRTTVRDLLDKLQAMAEQEGKPVVFSITDHESILGCIEANELLKNNPEKYNLLKFIPGIEFSTSLKSLGTDEEGLSLFSHCHLLGYNYNLDDPELVTFSKLIYQKNYNPANKGQSWPTGYSVIMAKKAVESKFGIKIPFAKLTGLIQPTWNHAQVYDLFVDTLKEEYKLSSSKIVECISDYFSRDSKSDEDILYNSKLDILDIINMIHNAGGYTSIAHANSIRYKKPERFVSPDGKKAYPFIDLINRVQQLTDNKGINAVELFHNENTDSAVFFILETLANQYGFYFTAGSDTHSPNINSDVLSKCTCKKFEKTSLPEGEQYTKGVVVNKVVSLPFVEKVLYGKDADNKQDYAIVNKFKGKLGKEGVEEIMTKIVGAKKAEKEQEGEKKVAPKPVVIQKIKQTNKNQTKKKKKKYNKKKKLHMKKKDYEYNPDDYYHVFSGSMKRDYQREREF